MLFVLSVLAALGTAICNGVSAILQKAGADSHPRAKSLHPGLMFRLLGNVPYVAGALIDLVAWALTLVAVHNLPLFLVQPITGLSVIVTVLIEWLYFKKPFHMPTLLAMLVILGGLSIIASQATVQTAHAVNGFSYIFIIVILPLILLALGLWSVRVQKPWATFLLSTLAGIGFGGTAITGRMLSIDKPYWHILITLPFLSLVAYGVIGVMLFTVALQRHHASTVNAAMITFETLVPLTVGLLVLGDKPRGGSIIVILFGAVIALAGTISVLIVQRGSFGSSAPRLQES